MNDDETGTERKGVIIIATYNEMGNLPRLVEELEERLPEFDLLVIDDNSPDGTGVWATERSKSDARLYLIQRDGKLGLGSATVLGFQWALDHNYPTVITMDSDFSHAPEDLEAMVAYFSDHPESDLVIGSRYVEGGGIEGWPLFRHLTSKLTNGLARIRLGLAPRDNTGAFRIYRSKALRGLDLARLHTGYAYLPELVWRLQNAGATIQEIPITFRDRVEGQTKTNVRIGLAVYWHLLTLPFRG